METEVYIDGDILPYQIGFATQRRLYRLDLEGLHSCSPFLVTTSKRKVTKFLKAIPDLVLTEALFAEEPIQALETLKLHIQNIVKGSKCNRFKVVLSSDENFRDSVATIQKYKGNRDGFIKPIHFNYLRDWLKGMPYTIVPENEEADDVISRAMIAGHVGASIDKDLNNTPGLHYNFNQKKLYEIDDLTAYKNFYKQMLTGDSADNIPGIKGYGPVKADNLISVCKSQEEMERAVYEVYKEHYDNPIKAMTEVGQLLWMRREPDEMWTPEIKE